MNAMEIGQRVKWQVGKIERQGLFMESIDNEFSEVMCTKAGDVPLALKCNVPTKLLSLI